MSIVKVRLKEVAADLGFAPKEVSEVLSRFFEKPKSNSQILTDEELNVLLDYVTQQHQIDSLEQVFAVQAKPAEKKPEPRQEEPKAAPAADKAAAPAAPAAALDVLGVLMMLVMSVGRLASGVHWLTDVLGGALLGAALTAAYAGVVARLDAAKAAKAD